MFDITKCKKFTSYIIVFQDNQIRFFLFSGVVGKSFLGDTAIDDVIFSPDCIASVPRVYPTFTPCTADEFPCATNGNCRLKSTKCNGKRDCKDNSDEYGCSHIGKRTGGNAGKAVGSVFGVLIVIALAVLGTLYYRRKSSDGNNFHVEFSAENLEVQANR